MDNAKNNETKMKNSLIEANSKLNLNEFGKRKLILESKPQVVFIELSRRCNLSCWMCHRFQLPKNSFADMPDEIINFLLDDLMPTATIVDFHGLGESTLHPRFAELVLAASTLGSRVRLVTNLNGLTKDIMHVLVDVNAMICFSLGALGQDNYKQIYSGGDFENLSSNLKYLQHLRKKTNTCHDIKCMTMLYEPNLADLEGLIHYIYMHDIRRIHIWPMWLKTDDHRFVGNHMKVWVQTVNNAFDLADKLEVEIRVVDWPVPPNRSSKTLLDYTCHRPWTHVHINYDGTIGLCDYNQNVDIMSELSVGNFPFMDVWNHQIYQDIRRNFRENVPSKSCVFCGDICRHTKYVDFDDDIIPELKQRVLSNRDRNL